MDMLFFVLTIITMLALIVVKILGISAAYVWLKGLASIFFIITGIMSYRKEKRNKNYFIWILLGLIFSFSGDIFMELCTNKGILFVIGVGSFAIAHIMYTAGFCSLKKVTRTDIIICLLIVIPMILLQLFGGFKYDGMQPIVMIYTILISFMVSKAISLRCYYKGNEQAVTLTIIGAVMFWISDLVLLFVFFSKYNYKELSYVNLIIYYTGQAILAKSLGYKLNVTKEKKSW